MSQPIYGIIPARYGSSRFPGKPMAEILGKPMFWHVYQRAVRSTSLTRVVLATDSTVIADKATELDIPVIITRDDHTSGTDRVLEAATKMDVGPEAIIVNIQGDEPVLEPAMLDQLTALFADPHVQVTTLAKAITPEQARDPNLVKVVRSQDGRGLYFSRAPVPFARDGSSSFLGHIGLYGFRFPVLEKFQTLGESPLERMEKLEQLRLLEAGIPIHVALTEYPSIGVDTREDLEKVRALLASS
ncbi:3-deoxy-manno-octulosonate cytidylyltransferase [Desulfoplanes formicivorans]|uniref:3-deoxy-manno-octulosonate cytidylyltransferase n=1 Tax=Desulfoplanes formicivorans TaxID=1592317 RepID=A0A194AIA8_9BACT|nr:3-deoxy-manno-octulosonate cytidylyltransferase [Desulfoplanes formicivorans]GAU09063.1 3-deoxy-manno-octulosonate cytidylyltransferase [Desulfoplanes formicivorans]